MRCLQACVRLRPLCALLYMHCDVVELCHSLKLRRVPASCVRCAQLYTHCEDVAAVNARRLAELPGEAVRFRAQDTGRAEALQACQVGMTDDLPWRSSQPELCSLGSLVMLQTSG